MPDVILASTTINLTEIRKATSTVPVVFVTVSDPVAQGFVASMRQPGGNHHRFQHTNSRSAANGLTCSKRCARPRAGRRHVQPDTSPQSKFFMQAIESAAPSLACRSIALPVRRLARSNPRWRFRKTAERRVDRAQSIFTRYALFDDRGLAARYRLPSIAAAIGFPKGGRTDGLRHPINLPGQCRQAQTTSIASSRAKPGDLPVQGADRYTFMINLKTAKALGLEVPPDVLSIADGVIE